MPKKKIDSKGKSKHTSEKKVFDLGTCENKFDDGADDEYTTVADAEANKKYSKRPIRSNWSKYETKISDFESEDDENEIPRTEDFDHLVKTASSDCSHFQFKSEKLWSSGESFIPPSNIFNLDLNILSSGLACLPFDERMGLDKSYVTVKDRQRFDAASEKSLKEYNLLREKLFKKVDSEPKVKKCENLKTLGELCREKLDINVKNETDNASGEKELTKTDTNLNKVENKSCDKKEVDESKYFGVSNADLEDWLDTVLDD